MFTDKDFENMGKAAAAEYISSNKSLNTTIVKMAEEYGLNPAQLARVVEQANVETYLKLNNIAEDKYIEFEPADPKVISSKLNFESIKTASTFEDIELPEEYNLVSPASKDEADRIFLSKEASLKKAIKSSEGALSGKLEEVDELFSRESENLYKLVKQASLETGSFGLVKHAMVYSTTDRMVNIITDVYKTRLQKEAQGKVNFDDVEKPNGVLNKEHPIVKSLAKMAALSEKYIVLKGLQKELYKAATQEKNVVDAKDKVSSLKDRIFKI